MNHRKRSSNTHPSMIILFAALLVLIPVLVRVEPFRSFCFSVFAAAFWSVLRAYLKKKKK